MRYLLAVSLLGLLRPSAASAVAEPQPPTLVPKCKIIEHLTLLTDCENATRSAASSTDSVPLRVQPMPQPAERPMTNMERVRRGLPLRYNLPKKKKGAMRRQGDTSPIPIVTYTGAIQVSDGDGPIGWFSSTGFNGDIYKYQTTFDSDVLRVRFDAPATYTTTNPDFKKIPVLTDNSQLNNMVGVTGSRIAMGLPSPYIISGANAGRFIGYILNTAQVSWSQATNPQDTIWTVNLNTGALTIEYINPGGGGDAAGTVFTNANTFGLLFGDAAEWTTATSEPTTVLQFQFIPTANLPS